MLKSHPGIRGNGILDPVINPERRSVNSLAFNWVNNPTFFSFAIFPGSNQQQQFFRTRAGEPE